MKRRLFWFWFFLGLAPAAAGLGPWGYAWLQYHFFQLTTEQALFIEVAVAIWLALAFYSIQNQNSVRRKQFWSHVAYSQLQAIKSYHEILKGTYERLLQEGLTKDNLEDVDRFLKESYNAVEVAHIRRLDMAMSQLADLLDDPSLFENITALNYYEFRYLLRPPIITKTTEVAPEKYDKEIMPVIKDSIPMIEERIKIIQEFMHRIQAEMPNKAI